MAGEGYEGQFDYTLTKTDINFGGGNLKINKTDSTYSDSDFSKFVSVGGTEREAGGVLKLGERQVESRFRENDIEEPAIQWITGQDVTFETTLVECSIENFVLAIGGNPWEIANNTTNKYKFYRHGQSRLPAKYPFLYEVVNDNNNALKDYLIMPNAEVIGAVEHKYGDLDGRYLKLTLKLHKGPDVVSSPELVSNSGFEVAPGGAAGVGTPFANWTAIATGSSTVTIAESIVVRDSNRPAIFEGMRACRLYCNDLSNIPSIEQTISTTSGYQYVLQFAVRMSAEFSGVGQYLPIIVTIGGTSYTIDLMSDFYWEPRIAFTATGSTTLIKIRGTVALGAWYIDAVSVKRTGSNASPGSLAGLKFELRRAYP
jgi:hypothetical protein